jgi:hypothetical protein
MSNRSSGVIDTCRGRVPRKVWAGGDANYNEPPPQKLVFADGILVQTNFSVF